jgi:hypothetical protein
MPSDHFECGMRLASSPAPLRRIVPSGDPPRVRERKRMSQLTTSPPRSDRSHLEKLCTSIRGKLQFMDYLVRAAVADVDRFDGESDPGTRIFLRQLIEMHASNLAVECENMRLVGELCHSLEAAVNAEPAPYQANGDAA